MGLRPIRVEVVLAPAAELRRVRITLAEGATVEQALRASGLVETLDADLPVGVFGRLRKLQDTVQDGDRVEIYRGLLVDPKAARRQRAARRKLRGAARPD